MAEWLWVVDVKPFLHNLVPDRFGKCARCSYNIFGVCRFIETTTGGTCGGPIWRYDVKTTWSIEK